ncbi:MAG: ribonuclease HIII [Acholeplasmataceae bacterium]
MKHYSMQVSELDLQKLNKMYANLLVKDDNQYLLFHAKHIETHILAYTNGKVLLQGDQVDQEIILIKKHLGLEDYAAIGSDEVGTGDVFGPIVVCTAYVEPSMMPMLDSLNVRDSKLMTDKVILQIGSKLAKDIPHTLLILSPTKYNELSKKSVNLNKMKALLHNQAIIKTAAKVDKQVPVILDQFCQPNLYFNYLSEETLVYRQINFYTKAESVHISVAVASIIARYAFLVRMVQLSKKFKLPLKKGASALVDEQVKELIDRGDLKRLHEVAKMNFKNVTKQLEV